MATENVKSPFSATGQRTGRSLTKAVQKAGEAFEAHNLRFTKLRQQVFEEIAATHSSVGAYDILERLAEKGTRLAPISVYRAIDALIEAGVIHRLESKNAYFACRRLDHDFVKSGRPLVLACESCGAVAEVDSEGVFETIDKIAGKAGFKPRVRFVELSGLCPRCAAKAEKADK